MSDDHLTYVLDGNVAVITLNRAEKFNAFTGEMSKSFLAAMRRARDEKQARAVVLTGEGRAFSAGADMSALQSLEGFSDVQDFLVDTYRPTIDVMSSMPKPIIAAVNGPAAGAGASFALACDLRVMGESAYLMQAFINIGLVPDAGSTWLLARQVGYSRAFQFAIEGTKLGAHRCLDLGLTNKVVADDDVLDEAMEWAHELAARPTIAVGLTKKLIGEALNISLDDSVALEADMQRYARATEDHREGVAAFLEKREPNFKGE